MKSLRVALCQINPTLGDLSGNRKLIVKRLQEAEEENVSLTIFPELALTGYPPRDIFLRPQFRKDAHEELNKVVQATKGLQTAAIVGSIHQVEPVMRGSTVSIRDGKVQEHAAGEAQEAESPYDQQAKKTLHNSAFLIHDGEILERVDKVHLPTYDVFDELRYFKGGSWRQVRAIENSHHMIGLTICEDIWRPDVPALLRGRGSEIICNISSSPYFQGREARREQLLAGRAQQLKVPIIYCNLVGGQDDLIFDGRSMIVASNGRILQLAASFEEDMLIAKVPFDRTEKGRLAVEVVAPGENLLSVHRALVLGIRDYFRKNGRKAAILGLSGGIDSALTAKLAVDALGKDAVTAVFMPSRFTSQLSQECAETVAKNLGIDLRETPIDGHIDPLIDGLKLEGTAAENLQARVRGTILMSLSNSSGALVLAPGNKSELATGYSTMYGDMVGALAPLADLYKTQVYALARFLNAQAKSTIIPQQVLERVPTAELREGQKDEDSLPPYELLDRMLEAHIEGMLDADALVGSGFDRVVVEKVMKLVKGSEFKRNQMPIGLRVTGKAFGSGRVYPVTSSFAGF